MKATTLVRWACQPQLGSVVPPQHPPVPQQLCLFSGKMQKQNPQKCSLLLWESWVESYYQNTGVLHHNNSLLLEKNG